MKSAFIELWKRARLWRFSLFLFIGGIVMAICFPPHYLKKTFPWLPGEEEKIPTALPANTNTDPQQQPSSASQPPTSPQQPAPEAKIGYLDQQLELTNSISIAGHKIYLPAGKWHPILTAQVPLSSPSGPSSSEINTSFISFTSFIRIDHGTITGVLATSATQQPIPLPSSELILSPCHDDRNYGTIKTITAQSVKCHFMNHVAFTENSIVLNPLIIKTIERIRMLGIPLSPFMIQDEWSGALMASPANNNQPSLWNTMFITTFFPPLIKGTNQLIAPAPYWDKKNLKTQPAVFNFITSMRQWAVQWGTLLDYALTHSDLPSFHPINDPNFFN